MQRYDLDVVTTRGQEIESRHRVHAAVVAESGDLIGGAGDPRLVSFWRSCAKPFQVMPLLQAGGFDQVGWGDDELALACASHGGEPEHVALAASMLESLELEEGDLVCGPAEPLSARGQKLLRESGERPTRLHNNCSGKHAAMLARALTAGWKIEGYERPDHGVQICCAAAVAKWANVDAAKMPRAVDGCGVVVFAMPLECMALAYARFGAAAERDEDIPARILHAIRTRPLLFGGTERFDTTLLEATEGRVFAKIGHEGVHSVSIPGDGIGFAVKVEDGATRAQYPAVLRLLQLLGQLDEQLPPELAEYMHKPLRNTRHEVIGEVRPAVVEGARMLTPARVR